jgi:predicted  nucleic acid-binding Zn-ribbon protein
MSLANRLYELQQVELVIAARQKALGEIEQQLNHNETYETAMSSLSSAEQSQAGLEKQYKEFEYEAEELRRNIHSINDKLYGGKIKNPKELLGYEQENESFKARLSKKDDVLLDLMDRIENGRTTIVSLRSEFKAADEAFSRLKTELTGRKESEKRELDELQARHQVMVSALAGPVLAGYQDLRSRKGQAVVKVEQGRCMGCRVGLSVNELNRVRGTEMVNCSNCGRILYLS